MGEARILKTGDTVTPNEFEFTYTGDYNYKEGASGTIEIEFLTSGTFTLLKSSPFKPFDLCLVGGGGNGGTGESGGGGGGYVENMFDVPIELNKAYPIVIGGSAGDTTGFGYTAKAGKTPGGFPGGDGGSGGGAYGGAGGFNGFDGFDGKKSSTVYKGGKGQHTSTRAFGTGRLLAGGGGGFGYANVTGGPGGGGNGGNASVAGGNGTANTGGGGGCGNPGGKGGSGIVILRRRWDADLNIFNTYNYITNNITTA